MPSPLAAFAALGLFWGSWSAVLPAIAGRLAPGRDDDLGLALLAVALGALPAMLLAGRIADRGRPGTLARAVALFGVASVLPAAAPSLAALSGALALVGAGSGGLDVIMNTAATRIEAATGRRLMHRAHAAFSAAVLASALGAGLLRDAGLDVRLILAAAALLILALAVLVGRLERREPQGAAVAPAPGPKVRPSPLLLALGLLCALAYLAENGLQLWSALHLERTLGARPAISGLGPGLLAGAAVLARLGSGILVGRLGEARLLLLAGAAAASGAAGFALAPSWPVALGALVLAGAAIAVSAPTLFSLTGQWSAAARRGSAVATVAVLAYSGFLAGPPLLGAVAQQHGLRAAILAVAAACLAFGGLGCALVLHRRRAQAAPFTA